MSPLYTIRRSPLVLVLLFIGAHSLQAQLESENFLGARWGATITATRKVLLARPGVTRGASDLQSSRTQVYLGGTVAGYDVKYIVASFNGEGRLYDGIIYFAPLEPESFDSQWAALKDQLEARYGTVEDETPSDDEVKRAKWTTAQQVTVLLYIDSEDNSIQLMYLNYPLSTVTKKKK